MSCIVITLPWKGPSLPWKGHPSPLPTFCTFADACSFFFINKKDRKLQPIQDYQPLNAVTKKNAAPIPLIPKLVNKLLGAQFFTKLDV